MAKRLPLPKRFCCAVTGKAYGALRDLNAEYGFGNNYCLSFLLEILDRIAGKDQLDATFRKKTLKYGTPEKGKV